MEPVTTSEVAEVASLIALIESDNLLPSGVRQRASKVRTLLPDAPELAFDRLERLANDCADRLPAAAPETDLARTVSVETFLQFHARLEVRAAYPTTESYEQALRREVDPDQRLWRDLSDQEVAFPPRHSWMCALEQVDRQPAEEIVRALALEYRPPVILFVLPLSHLLRLGVLIRPARAVDAISQRFTQWSPIGPSPGVLEFVDASVPREAVGDVRWLP